MIAFEDEMYSIVFRIPNVRECTDLISGVLY